MIYPQPLKQGSKLAITAFSQGIEEAHLARLDAVIDNLTGQGLQVIKGNIIVGNHKGASASAQARATELMRFLLDDSIDAIAPPWGGELGIEVLPLLDWQALSNAKPKWIFGFSDVSTLACAIHYKLGWATVHSANLMDMVATATDMLTRQTIHHLKQPHGSAIIQYASQKHSRNWPDIAQEPEGIVVADTRTQWQWLLEPPNGEINGRLVGGCWDIMVHLLQSDYLDLAHLKAPEGLILYLENCEMSALAVRRAVHGMAFRGVFKHINALVLGRNYALDDQDPNALTYHEAIAQLTAYNIPVLIDLDIGHVPPNLTLLNGALASIKQEHGQWLIRQQLV